MMSMMYMLSALSRDRTVGKPGEKRKKMGSVEDGLDCLP